ncbi:MAG: VOC family protein [Actinobacteria bacterium]|nr:VOC family protein [Actinomycetota bacterium]
MRLVSLATMLCVHDVERSTAFYRDQLGFEVVSYEPEIALLRIDSGLVYLFAESEPTEDKPAVHLAPGPGSVILVLAVEDCREAYEELRARGVEFLTPPKQPSWGGWRCFAHDPDGYLIEVEDWAGELHAE